MESKSKDELSAALGKGQKVRNFFNNIVNPWHEGNFITIDTHQVRGSFLRPLAGKDAELMHVFGSDLIPRSEISGLNGTYAVYHEAAEQAARQLGLRGNELQSVVWESVRKVYAELGPNEKRALNQIWLSVDQGLVGREEAARRSTRILFGRR
jgi:hypothetical protein